MAVLKRPDTDPPLEEFLGRVRPELEAQLARFRIPRPDAEDLVQETLLSYLYHRHEVYDPERWLLGALRKRCLMYWRTRKRKLYRAVDSALLECVAEPGEPTQESAARAWDVGSAISGLPPRCQSALHLRYHMGCEPAETAAKLGYQSSSIYKILERCLAALTRKLVASGLVERTSDA